MHNYYHVCSALKETQEKLQETFQKQEEEWKTETERYKMLLSSKESSLQKAESEKRELVLSVKHFDCMATVWFMCCIPPSSAGKCFW